MNPILLAQMIQEVIEALGASATPFVGFMGGVFLPREVLFPLTTHSLNYGSSEFEGIRAFRQPDGRLGILMLDQHLDRMWHSMEVARKTPPMDKAAFRQLVLDVTALNDTNPATPSLYIRPLSFNGIDMVKSLPDGTPNPNYGVGLGVNPTRTSTWMGVVNVPWGEYVPKSFNDGADVLVRNRTRTSADMAVGTAKMAGFYGLFGSPDSVLAAQLGCDETIYGGGGVALDGAGQELIVLDEEGQLIVLSYDNVNILHSLTRWLLTEGLTERDARQFPFVSVPRLDLWRAHTWQGMALVGTASGVAPVTRLNFEKDGQVTHRLPIGKGEPHPKILALAEFYRQLTRGQHQAYRHLLTPVPTAREVFDRYNRSGLMSGPARPGFSGSVTAVGRRWSREVYSPDSSGAESLAKRGVYRGQVSTSRPGRIHFSAKKLDFNGKTCYTVHSDTNTKKQAQRRSFRPRSGGPGRCCCPLISNHEESSRQKNCSQEGR